ncbi:hypothetical protein CO038_04610 [Candidatus Pacearchaeota archaeon CG_4_9_14_0_2_um_filter_39_13]|nr:MAG: hypothetical protein CO038_04610 [Candidatus Pacearchaeota archaeon CG_4_9_14_0_2_um_filter_39_13]
MKVYLIRHAESIGNARGIHQGHTNDFSLSELGRKQADFLKKEFEDLKIDAIYSSDFKRAKETAEFLSKPRNLINVVDKRLRERNFGLIGEEKDLMKAWDNFLKQQVKKGINAREATPPYGESDKDHFDRVNSFFEDLKKNHQKDSIIVVVAHAGTNKVAFGVIDHFPLSQMYKTPQGNACINELILKDDKWEVKSINSMKHLKVDPDIIRDFTTVRDEPLDVIKNRCWEKNLRLKNNFENKGYKTKYKLCYFNWSEQNLPEEILSLPHNDSDYHLFLEIKVDGLKLIVDASNDYLLPKYNSWDARSNCDLCVIPKEFIEEDVEKIIMEKLNENYSGNQLVFLNKVNSFFEGLRRNNIILADKTK